MFKNVLEPLFRLSLCETCRQLPGGGAQCCMGCGRPGKGLMAFFCRSCQRKFQGQPEFRHCVRCGAQNDAPISAEQIRQVVEDRGFRNDVRRAKAGFQAGGVMVILMLVVAGFLLFQMWVAR